MPRRREYKGIYISIRGTNGRAVAVQERGDAPGRARVRWIGDDGRYCYVPLRSLALRDEEGREIETAVEHAHNICAAASRARTAGADVEHAVTMKLAELGLLGGDGPSPVLRPPISPTIAAGNDERAVTLGEAFESYFALGTGQYADDSRQRHDEHGMRDDIFLVFSEATPVSAIQTDHFQQLWRECARLHFSGKRRFVRVGRPPSNRRGTSERPSTDANDARAGVHSIQWGGPRHAERTVNTLRKLIAFCARIGVLKRGDAPLMPERWKSKLKEEWAEAAKRRGAIPVVMRPVRLRHEPEEGAKLFHALCNADPRLRLELELFLLWRLGQGRLVHRADVDLTIGDFGVIHCAGRVLKWGTVVWMTEWQRWVLDDALSGFLAKYEAAYRAGTLTNYPLIPGGRLNSRKATLTVAPLSRSGLRDLFNDAEAVADVAHKAGRGWYGIKRLAIRTMAKLCSGDPQLRGLLMGVDALKEDSTMDRLQNSLTGHSSTSTRQIYLELDEPDLWRRAILVVEAVRRKLGGDTHPV